MKKRIYILTLSLLAMMSVSAQDLKMGLDWGKMDQNQKKEAVKKMSPEERRELLKKFKEDFMISDLKIDEKNQEEFKKIYEEYQEEQRRIKSQFDPHFNPDDLSNEEAQRKLEESFAVGEKLLENRRKYAEKMKRIMTPQQLLKLYQNEGQMRDKMLDRRIDGMNREGGGRSPQSRNGQGSRSGNSSRGR